MNFFLLINVKMPTIVGILTFKGGKNNILGLPEPNKCCFSGYFYTYELSKFLEHEKSSKSRGQVSEYVVSVESSCLFHHRSSCSCGRFLR